MDPSDMFLKADESMLLVVDIQEKLLPAMKHGEQVIENSEKLIKAAKLFGVPVLCTEQYTKGLGPTAPVLLEAMEDIKRMEKVSFSCMRNGEIEEEIDDLKKDQIVLCGMETHVCVFQTALDLLSKGKKVFMAADAVCSRSKANWKNALRQLSAGGGLVTMTEIIIFQWLERADRPEFKEAQKLIK